MLALDAEQPAVGADAGIDDGEHDRARREVLDGPDEGQGPGLHVVGRDLVAEVDEA